MDIEAEIITGCLRKSEKHQALLYRQYFGYVKAISLAYTNDPDVALEITNDSFMKAFQSIGAYDREKPFKVWLRKIAVNTAIDYYRKNKKYLNNVEIVETSCGAPYAITIIDQLTVDDIYKLINSLPDIQKFIFNLYAIEGYNHAEIATALDIPESTSRAYLTRAKKRLQELVRNNF